MESHRAHISSAVTSIDELQTQLAVIANQYRGTARDDIALDLDEVERQLVGASRRLSRLIRKLD